MAQTAFAEWFAFAEQIGVFTYLLPFLFTFTVLYMVLDKMAPMLGGNKQSNVIISVVIALFVVRFAPSVVGQFYTNFFTAIAVVLVAALAAMMVFGLVFRGRFEEYGQGWFKALAVLGGFAVVFIFLASGGLDIILAGQGMTGLPAAALQNAVGVVVLIAVLLFFYWAFSGGEGGGDGQ